jgi:hypothetical protein
MLTFLAWVVLAAPIALAALWVRAPLTKCATEAAAG